MRVFLTGISCVGKTTIGTRLATLFGFQFFGLDDEIESVVGNILNGEKIEVSSLKIKYDTENNLKLIYPLLNVRRSWLVNWLENQEHEYKYSTNDSYAVDLIEFFEGFIPDVRENILKSALYVINECVYD